MKVCHVTSVHKSNDGRVFYKECVSLAKAGYDVYLVSQGSSREESGVHVVGLGDAPNSRMKRMVAFSKKVYEAALELNADIYHLHDPELLPYSLKLKKHGKKVIYDSHENYVQQIRIKKYIPKILRNSISYVYEKYEAFVLKSIDGAIFTCTVNGVNPFEGKCRCIETVDNFPIITELYDKYDSEAEKIKGSIVYIGSITHDRGVTNLIRAMENVDGTLLLAGPFETEEYEKELRQLPGWSKVEYQGILNREQVRELLNKSELGACTLLNVGQYNKDDNLATKAYEYMSLALPVLLTESPYNRKVIEEYDFGLCTDPDNIDSLAAAINWFFSHPDEAKRMGAKGRVAVANVFNWETQEKNLLELYENM